MIYSFTKLVMFGLKLTNSCKLCEKSSIIRFPVLDLSLSSFNSLSCPICTKSTGSNISSLKDMFDAVKHVNLVIGESAVEKKRKTFNRGKRLDHI